jgi:RHS repeat-associated protein
LRRRLLHVARAVVSCVVSLALTAVSFPGWSAFSPSVAYAASPPALSTVAPLAGPAGTSVTITGTDFGVTQGTSRVRFAGYSAAVSSWSDTSIVCTVPAGAVTGYAGVWVAGVASNGVYFYVGTVPSIASINPAAGPLGSTVTLTGAGFGASRGSGRVTFSGIEAATSSWSDTSIVCTVPAGAASGYVGVWQSGICSNGRFFTPGTVPTVSSLSGDVVSVGTTVTVAGTNFGATQGSGSVTLGGVAMTATSWSDTAVTFVLPVGASAGYVGVWQGGICSNGRWLTPAPRIDTLSRWWGSEGTTLAISGAGFGATQTDGRVTFAGTEATVQSWSANEVVVAVPIGASAGYVGLWKGGAYSNGVWFLPMSAPVITDVNPIEAPVGGIVTVAGSGFGASKGTSDKVTFSGLEAPVIGWSETSITVQVPVGATSGYIGAWRSGVASNGYAFAVTAGTAALGAERYYSLAAGVNVGSGNLVMTGFSSSIPGNGEGSQLSSTFNSADTQDGIAGSGWTFSFEQRLISYPSGCEAWLQPDGSMHVFGRRSDGSYVSAQGEYATLTKNGDGTFTLVDRDAWTYQFDAARLLRSKTDRNGNATTLTYDGSGRATGMTDASGRTSTFEHDVDGRLISVTDAAGRVTDFEYDIDGRLVLMTLPTVHVGPTPTRYTVAYDYDASGRLVGVTDSRGKTTSYAYDGATTRVASITDPEAAVTSFTYNPSTGASTLTDAGGGVLALVCDAAATVVRSTPPSGISVLNAYDAQRNLVGAVDSSGASYVAAYDERGRQVSSTDPLGQTTTMSYAATATGNEPESIATPDGATTSMVYNAAGNKTAETDPTGAMTTYAYDEAGKTTGVTDATGRTTSMSYDTGGNMAAMTDAAGQTTTIEYDALGNAVSGREPGGAVSSMTYDELGRLTRVQDPLGAVQSFSYDENGNRKATTDAKGNQVLSVYDDANRLVGVTPDPVIRSQESTGNATAVSVGAVSYTYDALGRQTTRTDQDGNIWTLTYDPITGNLASETDVAGRATTYSYNALGSRTGIAFPDGTSSSFAYNTAGQVTSKNEGGRSLTYSYDAAGKLTGQTLVGGVSVTQLFDLAGRLATETVGENVTSYRYDAAGRVTKTSPSGLTARDTSYDVAGRPTTVTAGTQWVAVDMNPAGFLARSRHSVGQRTEYAYDTAGKVTSLANVSSGGTTQTSQAYVYDEIGNVAVKTGTGGERRYYYDNLSQVSNVRDGSGSLLAAYRYDPAGNRTESFVSGDGTATYSYETTDTTRLTKITAPSSTTTYTYDDQGRVKTTSAAAGTTTFTWAADGYLASVSLPDGRRVAYDYDASWRMVSRAVCSPGVTATTTYQYDGDRLVAEKDSGGDIIASYLYGPDGRIATMTRGGATYTYQLDSQGSVLALANAAGTLVNAYAYDTFGQVMAMTEGVTNPFTYAGYRADADTGLYHLKARWYDAYAGRFLSKDAVQDVAGDTLSANHYLYCKNNPVNMVDPEGTWALWAHTTTGYSMYGIAAVTISAAVALLVSVAPAAAKWLAKEVAGYYATKAIQYWRGQLAGKAWDILSAGAQARWKLKPWLRGYMSSWVFEKIWYRIEGWALGYSDTAVWHIRAGLGHWGQWH